MSLNGFIVCPRCGNGWYGGIPYNLFGKDLEEFKKSSCGCKNRVYTKQEKEENSTWKKFCTPITKKELADFSKESQRRTVKYYTNIILSMMLVNKNAK